MRTPEEQREIEREFEALKRPDDSVSAIDLKRLTEAHKDVEILVLRDLLLSEREELREAYRLNREITGRKHAITYILLISISISIFFMQSGYARQYMISLIVATSFIGAICLIYSTLLTLAPGIVLFNPFKWLLIQKYRQEQKERHEYIMFLRAEVKRMRATENESGR